MSGSPNRAPGSSLDAARSEEPGARRRDGVFFSEDGTAIPITILHHKLTRKYFAISEDTVERIKKGFESDWRDPCLVSLSIGLATGLNALAEARRTTAVTVSPTEPLFVNSVLAVAGLVLSAIFGWLWWKNRADRSKLISDMLGMEGLVLEEKTLRRQPQSEATVEKSAETSAEKEPVPLHGLAAGGV